MMQRDDDRERNWRRQDGDRWGRDERGHEDRGRYDDRGQYGSDRPYAEAPRSEHGRGYDREREGYGRQGYGRQDYGRQDDDRGRFGQERFGGEGYEGRGRGGWSGREDWGREGYAGRGYESGRQGYGGSFGEQGREQGYGQPGGGYLTYTETWLIAGPFVGRGPRNYRRSDERILEEVCERLTQHGQIDAGDVEVDVRDGEVTLRGNVVDRRIKRMAEDTAESVSGVREVHNQLRVGGQRGGMAGFDDRGRQQPGRTMGAASSTMAAGATSGQDGRRRQLREGTDVYGSDDDHVGKVKEVRDNDFLVDRSWQRDIYVPFSAIMNVREDRVVLSVTADKVDNMGWDSPDVASSDDDRDDSRRARTEAGRTDADLVTAGSRDASTGTGYRYGSAMAGDPRYQGRSFEEVEPDLRSGYGEWSRREGRDADGDDSAWDRLRDDVRRAWDETRR